MTEQHAALPYQGSERRRARGGADLRRGSMAEYAVDLWVRLWVRMEFWIIMQ